MSGTTVWVIVIAIVVIVVIAVLLVLRSRRRGSANSNMGLPDLGALSTEGLDKEHAHGDGPTAPGTAPDRPTTPDQGR